MPTNLPVKKLGLRILNHVTKSRKGNLFYTQLLIPAVIGKTDQRKYDRHLNQYAYYSDQGCTRLQNEQRYGNRYCQFKETD